MPTDESYLDNLLKGLTSDTGDKEDDRLSAYRRRRNGEIRDSYERQEIPGFLNDYVEDDKKLKFHVVPDQEDINGDFDFQDDDIAEHDYFDDDDRDNEDFGQDADDTIENYDIFEDDIDDSLIDKMIASELSEDDDFREPFGVSATAAPDEFFEEEDGAQDADDTVEMADYTEPDTLVEAESSMESDTLVESESITEPDTLVEAESSMESDTLVESESIMEPDTLVESESIMEPDTLVEAESFMEPDTLVEAESIMEPDTLVEAESTMEADAPVEMESFMDTDTPAENEEAAEAVDEWVVDNSVEEIPPEDDNSNVEIISDGGVSDDELADIFSGGAEESGPQSLNDIEGLEGLSSEDISSLDGLFSELEDDTGESEKKKEVKKEKVPFLLKIFGNVPIPEDKIKPEPTEEELAAKKAEAAEKKKAAKEEKKKAADEKKKAAADAKAAKARQSAEEKAEAKAKKREQMEKMLLEDVGNTQKLNLAGIIVIFAMFAAIAALIISSINTASYNASIKEAEKYFNAALEEKNPELYTEAYQQLLGLKIKDKDKILEDKVYTVNFVNEDITSFNNHYALGDKVRALRDLLDGVMTYNFYIDHAYELEIEDHLLYLRSILIGLLESEYEISEDEAVKVIHDYDDMEKKLGERAAKVYITTYIYDKVKLLSNNSKAR